MHFAAPCEFGYRFDSIGEGCNGRVFDCHMPASPVWSGQHWINLINTTLCIYYTHPPTQSTRSAVF